LRPAEWCTDVGYGLGVDTGAVTACFFEIVQDPLEERH